MNHDDDPASKLSSLWASRNPILKPLPPPYFQPTYKPTKIRYGEKLSLSTFIEDVIRPGPSGINHPISVARTSLASSAPGQIGFNSVGDLFVCLPFLGSILHFLSDGTLVRKIGLPRPSLSLMNSFVIVPEERIESVIFGDIIGMAIDFENRLFLGEQDGSNGALRVMDFQQGHVKCLCSSEFRTQRDGPLPQACFNGPTHLTFTKKGDLLVLDSRSDALRIVKSVLPSASSTAFSSTELSSSDSNGSVELRRIAARSGIGTITEESLVFTLAESSAFAANSFSLLHSGEIFLRQRMICLLIGRDGMLREAGVSGDGLADVIFEDQFAAVLAKREKFGLVPIDPNTGLIASACPENMLINCPKPPSSVEINNILTGASDPPADNNFFFSEERSYLAPLPDRTGYLVAHNVMAVTDLSIITGEQYGPRFSTPPHLSRPFNLSSLLRNPPELLPSSTLFRSPTNTPSKSTRSFPLHELVLRRRCPALLDPLIQNEIFDAAIAIEAFEDLFSFIYEDCLPPLGVNHSDTILRFLDLYYLSNICKLDLLAGFAKHRCFSLVLSGFGPTSFDPLSILARYSRDILSKHQFAQALAIFQSIITDTNSLSPDSEAKKHIKVHEMVASVIFQNQSDEFIEYNNFTPEIKARLEELKLLAPCLVPIDPFGRLGECFVDLCPELVAPGTKASSAGESLLNGENAPDFEFEVDGHIFPCHSLIMSARWSFFAKMMQSGLGEAKDRRWKIEWAWTPAGFHSFLIYLYTGYFTQIVDRDTCSGIVQQADFLRLDASNSDHEDFYRHCARFCHLEALKDAHDSAYTHPEAQTQALEWLIEVLKDGDQSQIEAAQTLVAQQLPAIHRDSAKLAIFESLPLSIRMPILLKNFVAAHPN